MKREQETYLIFKKEECRQSFLSTAFPNRYFFFLKNSLREDTEDCREESDMISSELYEDKVQDGELVKGAIPGKQTCFRGGRHKPLRGV